MVVVVRVVAFDGSVVVLSEERWRHIVLRHPEMRFKKDMILSAVSGPDEVYVDSTNAFHVLKRLVDEVSDYVVVVYCLSGEEGYIRTAYYTSFGRKARRYKSFRRLRLS